MNRANLRWCLPGMLWVFLVAVGGGCRQETGKQAGDTVTPAAADAATEPGRAHAPPAAEPEYLDTAHAPVGEGWKPLFNGHDLQGWKFFPEDRENSWKVENAVLINATADGRHGTNLYTEAEYDNFEIYYEYRIGPGSNSGVFLRGIYEIQIIDDSDVAEGQPPKDWGNGGFYGKKAPDRNVSKAAEQWQSIYARLTGKTATVVLNGQVIHQDYELPGPTFIYPQFRERLAEGRPGPIILQGDHGPVAFRRLMIKPLP